jgi:hypothetical protein
VGLYFLLEERTAMAMKQNLKNNSSVSQCQEDTQQKETALLSDFNVSSIFAF